MNIVDFISELSDEYNQIIENNEEEKESNIGLHGNHHVHKVRHKHLKLEILKKQFFAKKNICFCIVWKLQEVIHIHQKMVSSGNTLLMYSHPTAQTLRLSNMELSPTP